MQKHPIQIVWALAAMLVVGSLAGGLVIAQNGRPAPASQATNGSADNLGPMVPAAGFASLVKKTGPSVVSIDSTKVVKTSNEQNNLFQYFRDIPGFQLPDGLNFQTPRFPQKQEAAGSGVIVSSDGYILTNNHVVDGASQVRIVLADKREFEAKVIGKDAKSDLAVLKINETGLPAMTLGDSSKVEVGDLALAIGNPFNIGQTVTMGIISALGRRLDNDQYENFIQTDAAVNPGNSGGALVNTRGELIGINTAILSESGGNQGIGFAIPSNMARTVMNAIKEHGQVTRGYFGVGIQDLNSALAKSFGSSDTKGALISSVEENSPAATAGIQRGDVVREVNGERVDDTASLKLKVGEMSPGSTASIKVLRNGVEKTLSVHVGTLPGTKTASAGSNDAPSLDSNLSGKLGVSLQDLTPQTAKQMNMLPGTTGVVVTQVLPDSPAANAGIRQGDVVEEINHQAVKSASELKEALNKTSNSVLLLIKREGRTIYTVVERAG